MYETYPPCLWVFGFKSCGYPKTPGVTSRAVTSRLWEHKRLVWVGEVGVSLESGPSQLLRIQKWKVPGWQRGVTIPSITP